MPASPNRAYLASCFGTSPKSSLTAGLQIRTERYMKFRTPPLKRKLYNIMKYEINKW